MKILVFTEKPFAPAAVEAISNVVNASGNDLEVVEKGSREDLLNAVKDANGLIVRSDVIDDAVMNAAPELKVIVRAGAGYDNIDLAAATKHGICVMNTPGQNSNAVAELVFGMIVMMCRNKYNGKSGSELKGKSLGIYAFGQVGRNVARIAKGFNMNIEALDVFVQHRGQRQRQRCHDQKPDHPPLHAVRLFAAPRLFQAQHPQPLVPQRRDLAPEGQKHRSQRPEVEQHVEQQMVFHVADGEKILQHGQMAGAGDG